MAFRHAQAVVQKIQSLRTVQRLALLTSANNQG